MNLPVLEIFGPTVQGEGMVIGRKTCFVRLAGCDYQCSWCDSKFTWDGSAKATAMSADAILAALQQLHNDQVDHITISGGNPALHKGLSALVALLQAHGFTVAIETQGSKWNDALLLMDEITLSPKPPSSGMDTDFTVLNLIIDKLRGRNVSLKIVIFDETDLHYATDIHKRYPELPLFLQVGNDKTDDSDEHTMASYLLRKYSELVEQVMQSPHLKSVRVLPQLHALLWGNRRGV